VPGGSATEPPLPLLQLATGSIPAAGSGSGTINSTQVQIVTTTHGGQGQPGGLDQQDLGQAGGLGSMAVHTVAAAVQAVHTVAAAVQAVHTVVVAVQAVPLGQYIHQTLQDTWQYLGCQGMLYWRRGV
jgi:hypothetical protein